MREQLVGWYVVLRRLVSDECHDHAVEIEEEHDEVEGQFDKGLLLAIRHGKSLG